MGSVGELGEAHLVRHGGLDVALRPEVLRAVCDTKDDVEHNWSACVRPGVVLTIIEIIIAAGLRYQGRRLAQSGCMCEAECGAYQVGIEHVEVAGLWQARAEVSFESGRRVGVAMVRLSSRAAPPGCSSGSRSVGLRTQPRKLSRGAGEKGGCGLLWVAFAPAKCWRPASVLQH